MNTKFQHNLHTGNANYLQYNTNILHRTCKQHAPSECRHFNQVTKPNTIHHVFKQNTTEINTHKILVILQMFIWCTVN